MRRALGRLLGVLFTLALVSIGALAAFSKLADALGPNPIRPQRLPLFFNTEPSNVHDRAQIAVQQITRGPNAEAAARDLARLGGAALPHVLPRLDELSPASRGKVAIALGPVAERMGLAKTNELASAERAMVFWTRFWQDHEFDFRPQVVRRLVLRLAERGSGPAREDVVRLDTYALPELVAALGRLRTEQDIERVRRLTGVLTHVAGQGATLDRNATLADAAEIARSWRRFLVEEGADFKTLDGPRRITAMFAQSQYGRWLGRVSGVIRVAHGTRPAFGLGPRVAVESGLRYLGALLGALGLAVLWAKVELRGKSSVRRGLRALAAFAVALPAPFLAGACGVTASGWARTLFAVFATALLGGAALSRIQVSALLDARFGPRIRTRAVLGGALGALPSVLPWVATCLFGLELSLEIDGVARATLQGLRSGDLTPGMTLALGGALGAAAIATLADGVMGWRVQTARPVVLIEVGGAPRARRVRIALAAGLLLGVLSVGWSGAGAGDAPGWDEVAEGARMLLSYGVITCVVAGLSGLLLGFSSASGPRLLDTLLVRGVEVAGALPAVLWAVALSQVVGFGTLLAFGLGLLRGVDVAWMLRAELLRRAYLDRELFPRPAGLRAHLSAYYYRRLRPAALPALCTLFMTPAWWVGLGSAAWLVGTQALPSQHGWGALLGVASAPSAPALVAGSLLGFITWVLLGFVTAVPRRLGGLRSSFPPPGP